MWRSRSSAHRPPLGQARRCHLPLGTNKRYPETVEVDLYKSTPNGFQQVSSQVLSVPVGNGNRTTSFALNYTFSQADAVVGKVTFRAIATIVGARDALPFDNEAIAPPTRVSR
jgi:hypothetical protein